METHENMCVIYFNMTKSSCSASLFQFVSAFLSFVMDILFFKKKRSKNTRKYKNKN